MPVQNKLEIPCAYCGRPFGRYTKDHVFPRAWYPDSTPLNVQRWTVPCCRQCNQEKSKLENYSFQRLSACINTKSEAASGIWERVFRGLSVEAAQNDSDRIHRRKAKDAFLKETVPPVRMRAAALAYLTPHRQPNSIGLSVKWKKITSLMELFARGCHYQIEGEPFPDDGEVKCHFPRSYSDFDPLLPLLAESRLYELGPGIVIRRGYAREGNQQASIYIFQFWGQLHFFVSAFAPPITEEL